MSNASRTLIETDSCPDELCRDEVEWHVQQLHIEELLGEGRLSSVMLCTCRLSGLQVALKVYHKQGMTMQNCKQVAREIQIHRNIEHPSILGLFAAFEDPDAIYLVQEVAPGGDLYHAMGEAGGYLGEEDVAQRIMRPLLSALAYLHHQGIIHRDIKPENLLIAADGSVRLADFGLAIDTSQETPKARVGTLDYFAPELVGDVVTDPKASTSGRNEYGSGVDVWAAGVLAYELMLGGPPFEADTKAETYARILSEDPFLPSMWSEDAADVLKQALTKSLKDRPTAAALLRHPWLTSSLSGEAKPPSTPQQ